MFCRAKLSPKDIATSHADPQGLKQTMPLYNKLNIAMGKLSGKFDVGGDLAKAYAAFGTKYPVAEQACSAYTTMLAQLHQCMSSFVVSVCGFEQQVSVSHNVAALVKQAHSLCHQLEQLSQWSPTPTDDVANLDITSKVISVLRESQTIARLDVSLANDAQTDYLHVAETSKHKFKAP